MCTGDLHTVLIPKLLLSQLHTVKYITGGSFTYSVQVQVKSCLIKPNKKLCDLILIESSRSLVPGIFVRCHKCCRFYL